MTPPLAPVPSESTLERIRLESERTLTPEEFEAWVSAPISTEERESVRDLIRWFCKRYPTAIERLKYSRRVWKRWSAARPR